MKWRAPRWLQAAALPLFMFPYLRDCRYGGDKGLKRGRRLSEDHGCGAMASLDGLPAAFHAFMQVGVCMRGARRGGHG